MKKFSLSSIYLYVIFIGVVVRLDGRQQKNVNPDDTKHTTFHLVHFFQHAYLWWCEVISRQSRKTHSDFFLQSSLLFDSILHCFFTVLFLFCCQRRAQHNMFGKVEMCRQWEKIIHLISMNWIKRQRVEGSGKKKSMKWVTKQKLLKMKILRSFESKIIFQKVTTIFTELILFRIWTLLIVLLFLIHWFYSKFVMVFFYKVVFFRSKRLYK